MNNFKAYFTEATKKDILSGLDKYTTEIKNDLNSRAAKINYIGGYDMENNYEGEIVDRMPPKVKKLSFTPHFYFDGHDTIYTTHPVILKVYDFYHNLQGNVKDLDEDIIDQFHSLLYAAYDEAIGIGNDPGEMNE